MIFTQTEGSMRAAVANMQAALAAKPDALITSIVDNNAFDELIKDARDAGVIVIAINVDDTEGAKGNARQAFIGQGFIPAGYSLGKAHVRRTSRRRADPRAGRRLGARPELVRAARAGVMKFLEEYKEANPTAR